MNKHQIIVLILGFFLPFLGFSQNQFLDFIINSDNDTIFGTIRNVEFKTRMLYEKRINPKKNKGKYILHKIKNQKKIRHNDLVYNYIKPSYDDGIYEKKDSSTINKDSVYTRIGNFFNVQKKLSDFAVTYENDTIYGKIKNPLIGKLKLLDSSKEKITKKKYKVYRLNNIIYHHKEKKRVALFDKKSGYLKLLLDGKMKLYEYEYRYTEPNTKSILATKYYFVEKNNQLILISSLLNLMKIKKLNDIFSDNQILISKINEKEYSIDNIYLIVKYYNESK